ncbi:MAG: YoaK family protein [Planctomycetota bacterium]
MLCTVAGALNAGGFFAVGIYTSHVTGHWSRVGDELALGHYGVAAGFAALVLVFLLGAMTSALFIQADLGARNRIRYTKPLVLELLLVVVFALVGSRYDGPKHQLAPYLTAVLSFAMGLQNALVTTASGAVVRTTHMTGVTTDLGIELVRLGFLVRDGKGALVRVQSHRALLHVLMLVSFGVGGAGGALAFLAWGYLGALPVILVLAVLVAIEVWLIVSEGRSSSA